MVSGMLTDPVLGRRRLREGAEFFRFLRRRRGAGVTSATPVPRA